MIEYTDLGVLYSTTFKDDIFMPKEKIQELPIGESIRYCYDQQDEPLPDYLDQDEKEFLGEQWFVDFKIVYRDAYGAVILITEAHNIGFEYNSRSSTYYSLIDGEGATYDERCCNTSWWFYEWKKD